MTDPIPFDQRQPLRTQADLEELWRELMGELGFAAPQIWTLLLHDGRVVQPIKLDELPLAPGDDAAERLASFVAMLRTVAPGAGCAFLFARPGGPTRTPADLAWARLLAAHTDWPVHLADDHHLQVVSGDDLVGAVAPGA